MRIEDQNCRTKMTPEDHLGALVAGLDQLKRLEAKFEAVPSEAFSEDVSEFLSARLSMIGKEIDAHQSALDKFLDATEDQLK